MNFLVQLCLSKQAVCLFVFSALLAGCSSKPYAVKLPEDIPVSGRNEIYVVSHGWHTGLVLPAKNIQDRLPGLKQRFGNTPWIEFGWGDKGFYQANEITIGLTFRAMFWSSGSVIHAVAVAGDIQEFFPNSDVRKLCFSDAALSSLLDFMEGSFARNPQGEIVALKDGIYGNSQFYDGVGVYHMFNTCNKWTAKGLQSAGMDVSPMLKLTSGSVMSYIESRASNCGGQPALVKGDVR